MGACACRPATSASADAIAKTGFGSGSGSDDTGTSPEHMVALPSSRTAQRQRQATSVSDISTSSPCASSQQRRIQLVRPLKLHVRVTGDASGDSVRDEDDDATGSVGGGGVNDDDWQSARSGFSTFSGTSDSERGEEEEDDDDVTVLANTAWAHSVAVLKAPTDGVSSHALVAPTSATSLDTSQPAQPPPTTYLQQQSHPPSLQGPPPSPFVEEDPQTKAWRMLEEASGSMEEDAIFQLNEGDVDANGTRTKKKSGGSSKGGVFGRIARVGKGMRMIKAVTGAMYAAGGVLDLTSFAGTPMRWHAPHSMLRMHSCGVSSLKVAAERNTGSSSMRKSKVGGDSSQRASRFFRLIIQTQRGFGEAAATLQQQRCHHERRLLYLSRQRQCPQRSTRRSGSRSYLTSSAPPLPPPSPRSVRGEEMPNTTLSNSQYGDEEEVARVLAKHCVKLAPGGAAVGGGL